MLRVYFSGGKDRNGLLISLFTASRINHCAIGNGTVVLEPTQNRLLLHPESRYILRAKNLVCSVDIPGQADLVSCQYDPVRGGKFRVWITLFIAFVVRHFTLGRVVLRPTCVDIIAGILREQAGLSVGKLIYSPSGLHRALTRTMGFQAEGFA